MTSTMTSATNDAIDPRILFDRAVATGAAVIPGINVDQLTDPTPCDEMDVRTMLGHPLSLPGLSDGGAHVGTVCDASFPTFLLTHWGRDRKDGRMEVEEIIKKQAFDTARYIGLNDRGAIAPGQKADINIIELDNLKLERPHLVADLPAGGKRLLQHARGYRHTLVNGVPITQDGKLTGERPGRLVRLGQA